MVDLMNSKSKENIIKDFYCWLFDKENINLISEPDLSLYYSHVDHNIYYPQEFEAFFNTKAMQRLGKISQLGLVLLGQYKGTYHTRLEHSKGTYYRKLEELIIQTQDENYKRYIEVNDLKIYLVAELLKMAGHDIGHMPLSHVLETAVQNRGFHEEIGRKILTEDPEIISAYNQISPNLKDVMGEVLSGDPMNFNQHDESNYDVDRLDYLQRDAVYAGKNSSYIFEPYEVIYAKTNEKGNILKNLDNSIVTTNSFNENSIAIDVYNRSSLRYIESFLHERVNAYKNIYFNNKSNIVDNCIKYLVTYLIDNKENISDNELIKFLENLKTAKSVSDIDIEDYKNWNDLRFISNCIDIGKSTENSDLAEYIGMIIPSLDNIINFTSEALKNESEYSDKEKEFLKKIKSIIKSDDDFSNILKNENSFFENTSFFYSEKFLELIPKVLRSKFKAVPSTISAYKAKHPIYVKSNDNKVYELHEHPERCTDWDKVKESYQVYYAFYPQLRLDGIPEHIIKQLSYYRGITNDKISLEYNQPTSAILNKNTKIRDFLDELE